MKKNDTLTPLRKLGYESGIGSESIVYNMFYVYFILFLTTVAGINPVLAGTISLISVLVDAVTDPQCRAGASRHRAADPSDRGVPGA